MKEQDIKLQTFKQELKELLEKYDATLEFSCSACSDLHGVYEEEMVVYFNKERTEYTLSQGYNVEPSDLED